MIGKVLTAINPAAGVAVEVAKGGLDILRRFWPVIVIGLVVWHYVGLRVTVTSQAAQLVALEQSLKAAESAVDRAQGMRASLLRFEATNADLATRVDQLTVNAAKWRVAALEAANQPPAVRIVYRDRVDGSTPESMAVSGAAVSREIAAQVRARLEGGAP